MWLGCDTFLEKGPVNVCLCGLSKMLLVNTGSLTSHENMTKKTVKPLIMETLSVFVYTVVNKTL